MKKAVEDLLRGELIGRNVKVGQVEGTIVDETKNMLVILTQEGLKKKYIKKAHKFEFNVNHRRVIIDGSLIAMKPEQRITIKLR
ncbi:ribonuclease P protein subunit [Candidatus Woesearchaeota archaeon]|nr:ribonuclease P protein subunit [Candidatus Woesearchaeota archaeon]